MNQDDQIPLVTVKILDRSYRIKCTPEDAPNLRSAAAHVDNEMRKLRQAGRVNSSESLAVVVALNIANELMGTKQGHAKSMSLNEERVMKMVQYIDQTLAQEAPVGVK